MSPAAREDKRCHHLVLRGDNSDGLVYVCACDFCSPLCVYTEDGVGGSLRNFGSFLRQTCRKNNNNNNDINGARYFGCLELQIWRKNTNFSSETRSGGGAKEAGGPPRNIKAIFILFLKIAVVSAERFQAVGL